MADLIESTIGWGWFMVIAMTSPFWGSALAFGISEWRAHRRRHLRLHTLSRDEMDTFMKHQTRDRNAR